MSRATRVRQLDSAEKCPFGDIIWVVRGPVPIIIGSYRDNP